MKQTYDTEVFCTMGNFTELEESNQVMAVPAQIKKNMIDQK